jgi:MoxR-like ATPase
MATDWWIYSGTGAPLDPAERDRRWPAPPRWRTSDGGPDEPAPPEDDPDLDRRLGAVVVSGRADEQEANLVNAALHLRRPLLVTGPPGSGRSTLAYRIARELRLGRVLRWPVTGRSSLRSGLYEYDSSVDDVGERIQLGPLGTALLPYRLPRVLLVEELDQGDVDLPYELATVFDQGEYEIRELVRVRARNPQVVVHTADGRTATVRSGRVRCHEFPIVVITGSDERELPSALRRHTLHLPLTEPDETRLTELVTAQFPDGADGSREVLRAYLDRRERVDGLVPDQLLNAVHLRAAGAFSAGDQDGWDRLVRAIWQPIAPAGP